MHLICVLLINKRFNAHASVDDHNLFICFICVCCLQYCKNAYLFYYFLACLFNFNELKDPGPKFGKKLRLDPDSEPNFVWIHHILRWLINKSTRCLFRL